MRGLQGRRQGADEAFRLVRAIWPDFLQRRQRDFEQPHHRLPGGRAVAAALEPPLRELVEPPTEHGGLRFANPPYVF